MNTDNIWILFTGLIYINSAFDVDASSVVLIVNILRTQEYHKAIRLYSLSWYILISVK